MSEDQSQPTEVEQQARNMGWVPQEEFKGDPERWSSAEDFVERGKHVLPILRKNNARLEESLHKQQNEIAELKALLKANSTAVTEIREAHEAQLKVAIEQTRKDVMASIRDARENGDILLEEQLRETLSDLKTQEKELKESKPTAPEPRAQTQTEQPPTDPEVLDWIKANPWWEKDAVKTIQAKQIAQILAKNPETLGKSTKEQFEMLDAELARLNQVADKVSSARPSSSGSGSSRTKGYADLPKDAKEACDSYEGTLVGANRKFKTREEWRADYARTYFEG